MKLSDAIRLGAMLKPQATGRFLTLDGRTCAMGAALDAGGALGLPALRDFDVNEPACEALAALYDRWPVLAAVVTAHGLRDTVLIHILALNDMRGWRREQIATWVATVEPPEPSEISESPVTDAAVNLLTVGS